MRLRSLLITVSVLALLAGHVEPTFAQASFKPVGTVGAQFLKIGVGARAVGMGSAYTAMVNDASSVFWNPAGLGLVEHRQVFYSYTSWIADTKHNAAAFAFPAGEKLGVFAVSFIFFSAGDLEETTEFDPQGTGRTFAPSDMAIAVSYGRRLTDKFTFGATGKVIRSTFDTQFTTRNNTKVDLNASGVAMDVGVLYRTGFRTLRIGIAFNNFGTEPEFKGQNQPSRFDPLKESNAFAIPQTLQFGAAMDFFETTPHKITVSADIGAPSDFNEKIFYGAEYTYRSTLHARAGIVTNNKQGAGDTTSKLSFGVGLSPKIGSREINLDAAYTDFDTFDNIVRFSVGANF